MRNFIGNILIGLAGIIRFLHTILLFLLVMGLCLGIMMITLIAFLELIGSVFGTHPEIQLDLIKKWYWEVIILFLGSATMWQGLKKMTDDDLFKGIGNKKEKTLF